MTKDRSRFYELKDSGSVWLCLLSGVLTFAAFPPSRCSGLAFVSLVPWLCSLRSRKSFLSACFVSGLFGGTFGLCVTAWLRFACSPRPNEWGQYWWAWPLLSAIIAGCYSLGGGMLWWLFRRCGLGVGFAAPLGIVCAESLLDWSVRGFACTTADLARLGLTQADTPTFRVLAHLAGLAGVSAWVAMVNGCIVDALWRHRSTELSTWRSISMTMASGMFVLTVAGWSSGSESQSKHISVGIVPGPFDGHDEALPRLARLRPQLCVWPELACSASMTGDDLETMLPVSRLVDCPILVGATRIAGRPLRMFNSMILVAPNGRLIEAYDKQWLGPGEEATLPITTMWSSLRSPLFEQYSAGHECRRIKMPGNTTFCVGICHDVCFTEWTRQVVGETPDFVIVGADERIDSTGRLSHLMLALTQFRAIECRRSIVRVSRPCLSGVINSQGTFVSQSLTDQGAKVVTVPMASAPSVRWSWGPYLFWCSILFPSGWQLLFRRASPSSAVQKQLSFSTPATDG